MNADPGAAYRVVRAVAFGDYLSNRERLQAVEVGIALERREGDEGQGAAEHGAEEAVLKRLRARRAALNLRLLESWMEQRTNLRVV